MDAKLSNVISQRISALFRGYKPPSNGSSENGISFENKNRSKELKRLAKSMEMDIPKLKGFLGAERRKTKNSSKMAQYIDWVAASSPEDQVGGSQKHKRSDDTGNATSLQESAKKARKNNEGARPSRDGQEGGSSKRGKGKGRQQNNQGGKDQSQRNHSQKDDAMQIDDSPAPSQGLATSAIVDKTLLSKTSFADLKDLHPATKRALSETMGLKFMTEIQDKTYAAASSGADVLGRARTGTGKTLAFLLPSLERIVTRKDLYKPGKNVGVLIISPTRELAMQIADQAQRLITFHSKDIKVQVMYGGTKMGKDTSFLNRRLPTVLVATPGRLLDHMENTELQNGRKFGSGVMSATPVVVLDEADRLLEMGFRREINKILAYLPTKENRQTLLFSATIPKELKQIMSENMRGDFVEVDCIQDRLQESGGQHTNAHVEQTHVILPSMDRYVASIVEIVQRAMQEDMKEHKVVVFFPTARVVGFFADFFNTGLKVEVIELHSRKSQTYRNKASEKFRNAKRGVLFTSDVSARGVDYPDVTRVIQFGLPESREQYIHRLGRTGRAGKSGQGLLVLAPFERKFLSELKGLEIPENSEVAGLLSRPTDDQVLQSVNNVLSRINEGKTPLTQSAEQAYRAFLGYYNGQMKRITLKTKAEVVAISNHFSSLMGLAEIPGLEPKTVGKMGLKGVPGLNVTRARPNPRGGRNW